MPARQSLLVELVGRREDLPNAIALNSSLVNGARLLGPPRIGAHGTPIVFVHPKDLGGMLVELMEAADGDH